jgi:hypothetical protein
MAFPYGNRREHIEKPIEDAAAGRGETAAGSLATASPKP